VGKKWKKPGGKRDRRLRKGHYQAVIEQLTLSAASIFRPAKGGGHVDISSVLVTRGKGSREVPG